jgi:Protein O-mannosyl-transferase TMEM260-like
MRDYMSKRVAAGILFLSIFILLYVTSYPSIGWWDSGFFASSAYNLSIPDPGGSILFVLLGRVFVLIFFFLSAVKAVTLINIISAGLASVFAYYTLLIIFDNLPIQLSGPGKILTSFFTSLSIPFLYSIWLESTAQRIYVLGLLLTGILIYCSIKIWFSHDESEKKRLIYLIVFILGTDYTAHRLNTPFIPIVLILLIFSLRKELKQFSFWIILIGLYFLGFSLNLLPLIRSQSHPPFSMDNIQNFSQLYAWIDMKRYGESNMSIIFNRRAPFWSYQVDHMYLRYFGWNFLGTQGNGTIFNQIYFSFIPLLLGIIGFFYSLIKKFKIWILIFAAFFFFSFGLVVYANIREGFEFIREIDRLFIPSFFVFTLWIGIGLYVLMNLINKLLLKIHFTKKIAIMKLSFIGFLILSLNIIITNWFKCNRSGYYFPDDFAYNLLVGCSKNALLFTNGDNDTFTPWYLQSVEAVRPDVALINLSLLNTSFYVDQLQRTYQLFLANSDILNPEKFIPSHIDSTVAIRIVLRDTFTKKEDTLKVEYKGRDFGKTQGLLPQDKALIELIETNSLEKPVYFASTADTNSMVGFASYLSTAGMIRQLIPAKGDSILPRQLEDNLLKKYRYRNFNNPDVYTDGTVNNLFNNYRHLFIQLSRYYLNKGDKEKAKEIFNIMQAKLPEWRFSEEQNRFVKDFKIELVK